MDFITISLLKKRIFLPIFLTQFFGAFNDNAFKFAMLTLISYYLSKTQAQSEQYQAIASALFIMPFFLFSATAGQLADKYDKAFLVKLIKSFEILLVSIGAFGFYFGYPWLMMITLTGMGIHSTFFGPIKYAILPDQLAPQQLLGATALIEASTFLAILLGTLFGTLSIAGLKTGSMYAIGLTAFAAVAGLTASLFILPTKARNIDSSTVDWNPLRSTSKVFKSVILNTRIMPAIFAISWFWLIGAVLLTKLPDYTNYVLHGDASVFAMFLALFSIGFALGSMVVNHLLAGRITLKYVPHAMLLLSLFAADLYWASPIVSSGPLHESLSLFFSYPSHWRIATDLFLLAFSGGLFVVPLYAYLQIVSESTIRARTIAANNIINALFMVLGTALVMLLLYLHFEIAHVFLVLAMLNAGASSIFFFYLGSQSRAGK